MPRNGQLRKPRLTEPQRRVLRYLVRVDIATAEAIYESGHSDSTSRTLRSLVAHGYVKVEGLTIAGWPKTVFVYRLTDAGLEAFSERENG